MKISDIYQIPNTHRLSPSKLRYLNSLVPEYPILNKTKKIKIKQTYFKKSPENTEQYTYVNHQNNINPHLFKPKYYFNSNNSELLIYCANQEVVAHTTRALATINSFMYLKDLEIELSKDEKDISKLDLGKTNSNLIICNIQSFLNFLKIIYFYSINLPEEKIQNYFTQKELSRLEAKNIQENLNHQTEIIDEKKYNFVDIFNLEFINTTSPYIHAVKISWGGTDLTVVQLVWGVTLAENLLKLIVENNQVSRIGFVGGAGCIGDNPADIDDVFVLDNVLYGNDKDGYELKNIKNQIKYVDENIFFQNKKTVVGNLKTVVPELGSISTTKHYKQSLDKISAFDMEFEGFHNALKGEDVKIAAIYYYMDKEDAGIELGDTYYYKPFLKKLFKDFNRGKYYCYEKVWNWFIQSK
ncbi:hypothetical protein GF362_01030 [Candidatus Dojkabacteria bacterium]|nr:hypothetical protein [Candidatus Dojkabacteria bacterium]